ncbi:MAG: nitroreductase family protein [Bdellovibrionales bacterium]
MNNHESPTPISVFEKLMTTRRSIRVFDRSRVPESVVRKAFDLAFLSPSSSNLQHWQFFRVTENLDEARICFLKQVPVMTCQEIIIAVARPDLWKQINNKLITRLHDARPPHYDYLVDYHTKRIPFNYERGFLGLQGFAKAMVTWLVGFARPVPRSGFFKRRLREVAVKSTALACQTFMLALAAQGYDSCPMEGFDAVRVRKFLKLPGDAIPVMGIAVGRRSASYIPNEQYRLGYHDKVVEL